MPPCLASPINDDKNAGMTMDDNSHTTLAVVDGVDGGGGGSRKVLFSSSDNKASDTVSVAHNNEATSATTSSIRSSLRSQFDNVTGRSPNRKNTYASRSSIASLERTSELSPSTSQSTTAAAPTTVATWSSRIASKPRKGRNSGEVRTSWATKSTGSCPSNSSSSRTEESTHRRRLASLTDLFSPTTKNGRQGSVDNVSGSGQDRNPITMPPCLASPINDDKNTGMTMATTMDDNNHTLAVVDGVDGGGGTRKVLFSFSHNKASDTFSVAHNNEAATSATSTISTPLRRSTRKRKANDPVVAVAAAVVEKLQPQPHKQKDDNNDDHDGDGDDYHSKLPNETTISTQPSNISESTTGTEEQSVTSSSPMTMITLMDTSPSSSFPPKILAVETATATATALKKTSAYNLRWTAETKDKHGECGDVQPTRPSSFRSPTKSSSKSSSSSSSRFPMLLQRPPSTIKKTPGGSILRRKCTPAKDGDIYDGTTRESSAIEPTSDHHFDALVAFATATNSPSQNNQNSLSSSQNSPSKYSPSKVTNENENASTTNTTTTEDDDDDALKQVVRQKIVVLPPKKIIELNSDTLREGLEVLFPDKFPPQKQQQQPTQRKLRLRLNQQKQQYNSQKKKSSPPCILPRLIACYTMYRKQQQQNQSSAIAIEDIDIYSIHNLLQKLVGLEWTVLEGHEHQDDEEESLSSSSPTNSNNNNNTNIKITYQDYFPPGGTSNNCWNKNTNSSEIISQEDKSDNDTTDGSEGGDRGNRDNQQDNIKTHTRRVQFAAFDGTAVVRGPSDVLEGSYKPQENCVQALVDVLDVVEKLFPQASGARVHAVTTEETIITATTTATPTAPGSRSPTVILQDLTSYLDSEFLSNGHDTICVESIMEMNHQSIPIRRIEKAAIAYSRDLHSLINPNGKIIRKIFAIACATNAEETTHVFVRSCPLSWECRLANASAQLVRYWLRTLLNPIPGRADEDTKTDQWSSRLYDHIILTEEDSSGGGDGDGNINSDDDDISIRTLDEDNLSSLLSNALQHVYKYVGIDSTTTTTTGAAMLSWKDRLLQVLPDESCCDTPVCREGLGSGRHPTYITEDNWEDVEQHLTVASDFCAFHRRALFLESLLSIVTKMNWDDHWSNTVQAAAKKLVSDDNMVAEGDDDSNNIIIQPEDEHLVLLGMSINDLLYRLRTEILPISRERYGVCYNNLRATEKNFRLGLSNTKRKKKCEPQIQKLEDYWNEDLHPGTIFPSISFRGSSSS
ncbi:hypothetical protein FRACYDRAFT_246821 [Fragilariopsis cylindrus CCMP1102]|uniref:Uncharacterized protein n=1 Tax=Fragilariopsis cylindrus CCMP1102 TaxID=635003 RepID=A0A1E7EYP0_9STRA|nr:hypothetical protein FRACYDRAFT_246821 [Fragilariopsis cylindrus CCMP1102]|eukprot:OEU10946.1 hypothetical protein FRACYDRAFT_246821 [Fragilariopsis cylindrus CCMP1102]